MDEFAEEEVVENPTLRAAYNLAPLHQNQPLRWDYDVHLIGEKIYDKVIHLCETCELPILVYGRMLPCKHIFCFDCAKSEKLCRRCSTKVQKVEKSALGTVFVCTYGAPKHNTNGCRRTYLSQRDLQSHIAHRHLPKATSTSSKHQAPVTSVQPAPNQLPLTQQQAAQQAAQKQGSSQGSAHSPALQSHLQHSPLPGQGAISQPAPNLSASTAPNPQALSPAPPLIPGLAELRPVVSSGQGQVMMGQGSPHLQPALSPNAHAQNSGLNFGSLTPTKSEIYRPLDLPPMAQQQTQQVMGMGGSQLQSNQNIQAYPQQLQFPVSTAMMQQLGSQQMTSMSQQMHPAPVPHQHSNLPAPQSMANNYNQNIAPALQTSQSRTNVNLITVPIQDEGQFRPLPYVNPSMTQQNGNNPIHSQPRANIPVQNQQPFSQPPISSSSFSNPSTFPQMGSQTMAGGISPQNLPYNQGTVMRNNNPGMIMNQRPGMGGNLHPSVTGALAGVMRAMNLAAARAQVGLMPTPVAGAQGVGNRFPQGGRWPAQVGIQQRMTQTPGPQRPRGDAQFNPGPYYN